MIPTRNDADIFTYLKGAEISDTTVIIKHTIVPGVIVQEVVGTEIRQQWDLDHIVVDGIGSVDIFGYRLKDNGQRAGKRGQRPVLVFPHHDRGMLNIVRRADLWRDQ